jgi:hypothetical protein
MPHCEKGIIASLDEGRKPMVGGALTYILFKECCEYTQRQGRSFSVYCVVMGSLICALLEFYRLKVARYEDEKIAENGEACALIG